MEVEFSFEDDENAGLWKFVCTCGLTLCDDHDHKMVNDGEIIECPKCHRRYKFIWKGMTVKPLRAP